MAVDQKTEPRKTRFRYRAMSETVWIQECGLCRTYGLQAEEKSSCNLCDPCDFHDSRDWKVIKMIHDITTDRRKANRIARLFTKHELAPIHFTDAVEDMLP